MDGSPERPADAISSFEFPPMKSPSPQTRRALMKVLTWFGVIGSVFGVYRAYRWAEPTPEALRHGQSPGGGSASIELKDAPIAGYVEGARSWSIHAGQIDILRVPNASLTNIQSATILNIRDGMLYDPPAKTARPAGATTTRVMEAGGVDAGSGPVSATFRAKEGHYTTGTSVTAPADLQLTHTVQWQFKLAGDVVFKTRTKDELSAPSMTILNLVNRRTGRQEQRILCDQGAKMTHLGIQVTANSIRFSPKDRTVECLSGVRGTYKQGSVQAERVYWSLNDEILRCPETATGKIEGNPFEAQGVTMDVKHGRHQFGPWHIRFDTNQRDRF